MQYKSMKIYRVGVTPIEQEHTFYILRVGSNAGKPLKTPCANCFCVICINAESYEFYYWLAFGLWKGKVFIPYLRGSVIEFVIKSDITKVLLDATAKVQPQYEFYRQTIQTINQCEKKLANLLHQAKLFNTAKEVLITQFLK